tara:strand:+ start:1593 stop:2144 length:552 start_codon:yes stop_codon:yes gene_type:complete
MDYKNYFNDYSESIFKLLNKVDTNLLNQSVELIKNKINKNAKIYIAGNGGSASIASHVSVDFAKVARVPSSTFNNSNLISCFANDYGYENWIKEAIKAYCSSDDTLILISSSGKSPNIVNAAKYCKEKSIDLITFSGFKEDNELRKLGNINFYVESDNYNYIEMTHHIILVSIVDIFANKISD